MYMYIMYAYTKQSSKSVTIPINYIYILYMYNKLSLKTSNYQLMSTYTILSTWLT